MSSTSVLSLCIIKQIFGSDGQAAEPSDRYRVSAAAVRGAKGMGVQVKCKQSRCCEAQYACKYQRKCKRAASDVWRREVTEHPSENQFEQLVQCTTAAK